MEHIKEDSKLIKINKINNTKIVEGNYIELIKNSNYKFTIDERRLIDKYIKDNLSSGPILLINNNIISSIETRLYKLRKKILLNYLDNSIIKSIYSTKTQKIILIDK